MRLPLLLMIFIIILNIVVDAYLYFRFKERFKSKVLCNFQLYSSLAFFVYIIVAISLPRRSIDNHGLVIIMWMLYSYFAFYIPKYIYCIFSWIGEIPKLFKRKEIPYVSLSGGIVGILIFIAMWWGALFTTNQIDVETENVNFTNLPSQFNNYRIVQFSDFHLGTYDGDTTFVAKVVKKINSLNPDLVVFTGDLVNRQSDELDPFIGTLSKIKSKDGVYSILGNHDYGDYRDWNSPEEKAENMQLMYRLQAKAGWKMLNNDHTIIKHNGDSIALIGVENWGDPPFKIYGDLSKAYPNLKDNVFKILLTHNPAHWNVEVLPNTNIELTLSGHTHAMQSVVGVSKYKFSPAKWRYKEWSGLYGNNQQKLYVNIGLGEVAIPSRIGATPELTLIILHNGK